MKKNIGSIAGLLLALSLLGACTIFVLELLYPNIRSGKDFRHLEFEENSYFLYDLGITDINKDGHLDVFTSNHYASGNIWFGSKSRFEKADDAKLGFAPELKYANVENMGEVREKTDEGLYIYWQDSTLVIENFSEAATIAVGKIQVPSPFISIVEEGKTSTKTATKNGNTTLDFSIESNSKITLNIDLVGEPINVTLNRAHFSLPIFVGDEKTADTEEFVIFLKDRHGIAWSDINMDDMLDFAIARGGLKGRMEAQPDPLIYKDELFVSDLDDAKYVDKLKNMPWNKHGCSMHQVAWLDINKDGQQDLYGSCRRLGQRNQLYIREGESLREAAGSFGLDFNHQWKGPFLWIDVDNDNDQDLLIEKNASVWLYRNEQQQFIGAEIRGINGRPIKFTMADIDNDADVDVYISSMEASTLLLNERGSFDAKDPQKYGLPSVAFSANWVDFDNDGLQDLHVLPSGVFRQKRDMSFTASKQLSLLFNISLEESRVSWFDMDNDGDRDAIIAIKYKPSFLKTALIKMGGSPGINKNWHLYLYENQTAAANWLQIDIRRKSQMQSVHGAVAEVRSGSSVYRAVVGESEGSHFSQGHYRAYFGLGGTDSVDSVRILWPDNSESVVNDPKINTLYAVPRGIQMDTAVR